jgi:hypothetical protein
MAISYQIKKYPSFIEYIKNAGIKYQNFKNIKNKNNSFQPNTNKKGVFF